MEFLKLYKEENKDILYSMSWLNKNSVFDKSTGNFEEIDLFTFLENINEFDYNEDTFYDDVYYILEYTKDSIVYLMNNINKEIKREHKILPISQAKEFDHKTIIWLSRQDGRTIKEKLKNNKIKTVKRYRNVDTYENRVFKKLLKNLVLVYEAREDLQNSDLTHFFSKIRQWLRSNDAKNIDEYKKIVYNNILLHHPYYSKIFKSYKWLNRLDEHIDNLIKKYIINIRAIIKFEIMSQLQFKTDEYILPNSLSVDYSGFNIEEKDSLIKSNIDGIIKKIRENMIQTKLPFSSIRKFSKYTIEKELNIKQNQNRAFSIDSISGEVFIDLFRLFPIARTRQELIKFPVTLKQKINENIVNATNTKIINLDIEIFTLPEILKTYNIDILKYFLEDFVKYFEYSKINYIIPDYINIFEFSQVKKIINSYFKNSKSVPKSILTGFKYLFDKNIKVGDTLINIQKDHDNNLFITPLLIKYDEQLKHITNGLYIEKHPTKKMKNHNDVLNSINKSLPINISEKVLNKFLQNGVKGIKEANIVFYKDKKIFNFKNLIISNLKHENSSLPEIKKLYGKNNLFNKKVIFLNDDKIENLDNYEKLLEYEKDGLVLWKEHLPNLSMEIVRDGYFDQFILVNYQTKVVNKMIEITEHFIIPKEIKELSFPLIFDNEKIDYIAYLKSQEFPFKDNIECELQLTYDYKSEELYQLNFIPLDTSYKTIKVKWQKEGNIEHEKLIYPEYPNNIVLEDDIENSIVKELNRLLTRLNLIEQNRGNENTYSFLNSGYTKAIFSRYWQNGNSIINSQNHELKQLVFDNITKFTELHDKLPYDLKNNIYLFLSYIHQDLIINQNTEFILKRFQEWELFYGLALGTLNMNWQQHLLQNMFKLDRFKQISILNIALWRNSSNFKKISEDNLMPLLEYIDNNLKYNEKEKEILTMLEFLLAVLRTKELDNNKILYPNKLITKKLLNTLKNRSKYLVQSWQLKSKISFGRIEKPENLQQMPDLLYATIYYLSNEDIENKIIINEIKS